MKIGHVHLKIRDLQRSVEFYRRYLGLKVTERLGEDFAFMSAGNMHHALALQQVGKQAHAPSRDDVGLYHVAFEVADREALAETWRKLQRDGLRASPVDHRISWAIYISDPDGNGIEVYWDTRQTGHGSATWEGIDRPLDTSQLN